MNYYSVILTYYDISDLATKSEGNDQINSI